MGKTVIYIYVCGQCHTIYAAKFEQKITHQHVLLRLEASLINGASVTIILCLHVLIAHRIFINLGYVDYFK